MATELKIKIQTLVHLPILCETRIILTYLFEIFYLKTVHQTNQLTSNDCDTYVPYGMECQLNDRQTSQKILWQLNDRQTSQKVVLVR